MHDSDKYDSNSLFLLPPTPLSTLFYLNLAFNTDMDLLLGCTTEGVDWLPPVTLKALVGATVSLTEGPSST